MLEMFKMSIDRCGRALTCVLLLAFLGACATTPLNGDQNGNGNGYGNGGPAQISDPLEPMNRYFFEINRGLDQLFLRPLAEIYRGVVPVVVRDGLRNFLRNLNTPRTFIHDLAQGEPDRAGQSLGRFSTNTLIGLGGAIDVAAGDIREYGLPYHSEDMGQTLAVWGVGAGPYLVVPFFGPSSLRDLTGTIVDSFIDPVSYLLPNEKRLGFGATKAAVSAIDFRSRSFNTLDEIERSSIDYYAAVRSLYSQYRRKEILNGRAAPEDEAPDIDIDDD